jgi:hypothetical protein
VGGSEFKKKRKGKSVSIIGLRAEESPDRRFVMFGEDSEMFWLRRKTRHIKPTHN